jgi:hypothetical protein
MHGGALDDPDGAVHPHNALSIITTVPLIARR